MRYSRKKNRQRINSGTSSYQFPFVQMISTVPFCLLLSGGFCGFALCMNTQYLPQSLSNLTEIIGFLTDTEKEGASGSGIVLDKIEIGDQ